MNINPETNSSAKRISTLLKRTFFTIAIIIIAFFVIAQSGTYLRDYLINTLHTTFLDIENGGQKVDLYSIYYYSAIYDLDGVEHSKYIEMQLSDEDTYKVEFILDNESDYIIIASTNTTYSKYLYLIPERIRKKGFDKIKITPLYGDRSFWVSDVSLHEDINLNDFTDYEVVDFEIKQIEITLAQEDLKSIAQHRANALYRGRILPDDEEYYKATLFADGKEQKMKMRLKGGYTDHIMSSKWSFRISIKDGSAWGMEKFSIHRPEARNGIYEYLMHTMYDELGGVSAYYDFAQVIVNGEYWGVYAIEQSTNKLMAENSLKREGAIITVEGNYKSYRSVYYNTFNLNVEDYSPFKVVSQNKTLSNENLYNYSQYAIDAYHKAIKSQAEPSEVYDYDLYAKYMAMTDIFKGNHGLNYANSLFYFNPITAKLEPISFDMLGMFSSYVPNSTYRGNSPTRDLFDDPEFIALYIKYLKELTPYYDEFIEKQSQAIINYNYIFNLDNVKIYDCDTDLAEHHKFILDTLDSEDSVFTVMRDISGQYYINAQSNSILAVDVQEILLDNEPLALEFNGREVDFYLPTNIADEDMSSLKVKYKPIYSPDAEIKTADVIIGFDEGSN
jgi:hypothetical protein